MRGPDSQRPDGERRTNTWDRRFLPYRQAETHGRRWYDEWMHYLLTRPWTMDRARLRQIVKEEMDKGSTIPIVIEGGVLDTDNLQQMEAIAKAIWHIGRDKPQG